MRLRSYLWAMHDDIAESVPETSFGDWMGYMVTCSVVGVVFLLTTSMDPVFFFLGMFVLSPVSLWWHVKVILTATKRRRKQRLTALRAMS